MSERHTKIRQQNEKLWIYEGPQGECDAQGSDFCAMLVTGALMTVESTYHTCCSSVS